jgi:lipopolysaccharide biosynthesis regulator YciM
MRARRSSAPWGAIAAAPRPTSSSATSRAIGLWKRALPLHALSGLPLYPRFSEAFAALRDFEGFEAMLRERLDHEPADAEASIWLARAVAEQKRSDEALAILRRVLDQAPGNLTAHAEIGRVLIRERRDFEALKSFEELLDRLPLDRPRLRCHSCGTQDATLHWRCPQCGEWDSFV